jgi:hypothetical protein
MSTDRSVSPRSKALALSLVFAMAALIFPSSHVAAQGEGTPEQRHACRPDVLRHCRGVRDDQAIESCLRANMWELRPACRRVFEGR